jgi:2,4-dienoyl-CoA reductase-like NADH-dependent reductase (Old Yellow Enzyme family)
MLNIPNPNYGCLEQRAGLLLHIGRDIQKRGKSGFNIELELSGTQFGKQSIAGPERIQAFEWLQNSGLIEIKKSETYRDLDGEATFVKITLTPKGKSAYDQAEKAYGDYLQSIKQTFT